MIYYGDVKLSEIRRFGPLTGWLGLNHPALFLHLFRIWGKTAYDTRKCEHHNSLQLRQVINMAKPGSLNCGPHINPTIRVLREELTEHWGAPAWWKNQWGVQVSLDMNSGKKGLSLTTKSAKLLILLNPDNYCHYFFNYLPKIVLKTFLLKNHHRFSLGNLLEEKKNKKTRKNTDSSSYIKSTTAQTDKGKPVGISYGYF